MNTTSPAAEMLQSALLHPRDGVVGLVDDLLRLCRQHGLQLNWQPDSCRVRSLADGSEVVLINPLRKSVFRSLLARVATLCNEQSPESVSPYGGQAELSFGDDSHTPFQVSFANTPDEQWLKLC